MVEENKEKQEVLEDKEEISKDKTLLQRKIDTELNLEKWPIWLPSHSPLTKKLKRTFTRIETLDNGSKLKIKLTLRSSGELGQPTTDDERVFYVLQEILEEKIKELLKEGKTKEELLAMKNFEVKVTGGELIKRLNIKKGGRQRKSLKDSLYRLRGTLGIWENSFYDSKEGRTLELLDTFNFLSSLKLAKSKKERKREKEPERFILKYALHPRIFYNIVNNYTKPKYLKVIFSLSELGQIFYRHIDLIMSKRTYYERNTKPLFFEDLGLEAKRYELAKIRKHILKQLFKEFKKKNIHLTTGIPLFEIKKTANGKDYKLICKKIPFEQLQKEIPELKEKILTKEEIEENLEQKAQQLHNYFLENYYLYPLEYRPPKRPLGKNELETLKESLEKYGFEKTKFIIDYIMKKATEANFKMYSVASQIPAYEKEAIEDFEEKQKLKEEQEKIKNCPLCDQYGFLLVYFPLEDYPGERIDKAVTCPHDKEKLKEEGIIFDENIKRWIKIEQDKNL